MVFFTIMAIVCTLFFYFSRKNKAIQFFKKSNPEFLQAKTISNSFEQYIFLNKSGEIAFLDCGKFILSPSKLAENVIVTNINEIIDFEVIKDGESSKKITGTVVGTILLGLPGMIGGFLLSGNKKFINELKVVFTTTNFENPNITFSFIKNKTKINSLKAKEEIAECQNLISSLKIMKEKNEINI